MRIAALLLLASACGRFGFQGNEHGGDDDGGVAIDDSLRDAPGDGLTGDAPIVCPGGVTLCDGFESGANAAWMYDPMVTVDSTHAHRGTSSMHAHSPAFSANTGSYHAVYLSAGSAINGPTMYLRGYFWLSALPAAGNGMEMITAEHPGSATGDYMFVESVRSTVYTQLDMGTNETLTLMPTGKWVCLIWKVVRDTGSAGSLTLQSDVPGLNLVEPNAQTESLANPIQFVTLGLGFSATNTPSAQPVLDLWIDDVIIDSNPLTCQE